MKFKLLFILFSILLLFFLASFILIPFYVFGSSFSISFWRMNWPLLLVWALIFTFFNAFYLTNRHLFLLLEKEDWPALVSYLEGRVINKGKYSPRLVRLLANSYLVLSDSSAVISLENKLSAVKPALIDANPLVFGTARILGKDISGAVRFFDARKDTAKKSLKDWVQWYYGFTLLLDRQFEKAAGIFSLLARLSRDGIITALSSYFLIENMTFVMPENESEYRKISSEGKKRVIKALPTAESYRKEASRLSTEIHIAAISSYIEEACLWLYSPSDHI